MNTGAIIQKINEIEAWVIETRREFHRYPELGMEEFRASQTISQLLDESRIPHYQIANTGIVGIIRGAKPGKTVALRADMDALPIQENTGLEYSSLNNGKMHACGHDAHMAILLGAAKVLYAIKEKFEGNIKLFFQPAEETEGGADLMIQTGCMEGPRVDYVLGLHVTPDAETGQIMVRRGKITASSDAVKIIIQGKSTHAAYPEEGIDAIVIAAQVIIALQTIISRNISPLDAGVITLGKINGGIKENIIANNVIISGTMRTLNPKIKNFIKDRIQAVVTGICQAMGGDCKIEFQEGYPSVINHDKVMKVIEANAQQFLGKENLVYKEQPSMGVEDFSFFSLHAPSAFYYLGCGNKAHGIDALGHSSKFLIDEKCLKIGVLLQVTNALALLKNEPKPTGNPGYS
jgi:amidohydrolase